MIPCKETRCLKQAICKTKRTIFCTSLYEYLYSNTENYQDGFYAFPSLIDVYKDRSDLVLNGTMDGAPIMNGTRLLKQMEKYNP